MRILAYDTASGGCAVCLYENGELKAERKYEKARELCKTLFDMIEDVIAQAQTTLQALDLIAVNCGPGSYTGIRAGLAAAKGFALAGGIEVYGANGIDIIARKVRNSGIKENLLVVTETGRKDFYWQFFPEKNNPSSSMAGPIEEMAEMVGNLQKITIAGNAGTRFQKEWADYIIQAEPKTNLPSFQLLAETFHHPPPFLIACQAEKAIKAGEKMNAEPIYLRPPDVTVRAKK